MAARNNLALCQTYLRNLPQAVEEMRQVVRILPNRALYRENLALYEDYNGDFQAAEQHVRAMQEPGLFGLLALAFAELGQERLPEAARDLPLNRNGRRTGRFVHGVRPRGSPCV